MSFCCIIYIPDLFEIKLKWDNLVHWSWTTDAKKSKALVCNPRATIHEEVRRLVDESHQMFSCPVVLKFDRRLRDVTADTKLRNDTTILKTNLAALRLCEVHYSDFIISAIASQITCLTIVSWTVYSRCRLKGTSKVRVTGLCEGIHR